LITKALRRELDALASDGAALVRTDPVDPAEAAAILARHVEALCGHALDGLPEQDQKARQVDVVNRVIAMLAGDEALRTAVAEEDAVEVPPTELQAVWPITGDPARDRVPPRPTAPLSASDLLVNARGEPALAHALGSEILSADSIDLLCAFVRWHGLRVLEEPLKAHPRLGRRLRVITTVYTGSTERKALDWLLDLGAEIKVSYDTQSTRLHAKAWLFRRATGYSTAYIGSSNLSKSALLDGVEWNVRLSQVGSPDVLDKFDATFESYWSSPEYEPYTGGAEQSRRLDQALSQRLQLLAFDEAFVHAQAVLVQVPLALLHVARGCGQLHGVAAHRLSPLF
jgi:HKD family nuclease